MIPRTEPTKLTEAKYTKLLKDVSEATANSVVNILEDFDDALTEASIEIPVPLTTLFFSKWRFYEINDEDETTFVQCVQDTYNEHANYYLEVAKNYFKEYDYMTGAKRRVDRHDDSTRVGSDTGTVTTDGDTKNYDLPNKVVNQQSEDGYLTDKTKDHNTVTNNLQDYSDTDYDSDITSYLDNEILDLKRKYMTQIRNVINEFADKFKDCFLMIY